jgi:putative colanic acid biosynthesis acetyltransferase WcaF
MRVDLSKSSNRGYVHARPYPVRALWLVVEALVLLNPLITSYGLKRWLLRRFGASVGRDVIIKPGVHVKCPWHLTVGDQSWIGERAWIDNYVTVRIGRNVCVSQGAYLCTGNHDWSDPGMGRLVEPIEIADGAWIGAFARLAPGVTVGEETVVTLGAVLTTDASSRGVYAGNPATLVRERRLRETVGPPDDAPAR